MAIAQNNLNTIEVEAPELMAELEEGRQTAEFSPSKFTPVQHR